MNIDFLRGFVEIARKKSIAKASEELHISHTALSNQLQSMEKHFDVQLVTRSSSGVKLTEAGQILYDSAVGILDQFSALSTALEPHRGWARVSIGTLPGIAARYLNTALTILKEQGREADLVLSHSTQDLYDLLLRGEVDVLVTERAAVHPSVWMTDLFEEPLYAVLPGNHPLAAKKSITFEQLSREDLILYPVGCTIRARLTALFETSNLQMKIKTEVGFHEVILGYVLSGAGITVLPESLVWHAESNRIRILSLIKPTASRTIAIASFQPLKAAKLLPFMRQAFTAAPVSASPKTCSEI